MAKPTEKSRGKFDEDSTAIFKIRQIKIKYKINNTKTPKIPHSSAITEKIKSVWGSGKKPYWTCEPLPRPSPKIRPEPMEILACVWLHELPKIS